VPPAWSFAPWKSRNVHKNREDVLEDVEKYRQYDLPASVLVIDSPWERGYNDFVLNDEQFTDPHAMFDRVQELGFYTCLWLTPFVNTQNVQDMKGITKGPTSNYEEAVAAGYLVKEFHWRGDDLRLVEGSGRAGRLHEPGGRRVVARPARQG
jgi:alpha-glucosidase (family GH31 glycosyl hydrolase)